MANKYFGGYAAHRVVKPIYELLEVPRHDVGDSQGTSIGQWMAAKFK
jgi:hypothetical protein